MLDELDEFGNEAGERGFRVLACKHNLQRDSVDGFEAVNEAAAVEDAHGQ